MKKILLSILSVAAIATASAGVSGTYVAVKYAGCDVGDTYKFTEPWSSEDPAEEGEEDAEWLIEVVDAEDGTYTVTNLIGWEEALPATFDAETGTITIPGGLVVDEEYGYMICGGLKSYSTADGIMSYCDANQSYIYATQAPVADIKLQLDGNTLSLATPILLYYDYYTKDYGPDYLGNAATIFSEMVMEKEASGESVDISGDYVAEYYAGCDVGDTYKFTETWSSEDPTEEGEEASDWVVAIAAEDGAYTVTNLLGWEETLPATFDAETSTITIPGGLVVDEEYGYMICGGLKGYTTAEEIMAYCDANTSYIFATAGPVADIKLTYADGVISLATPILLYYDYYTKDYGPDYLGNASSIYSEMVLKYKSGSDSVKDIIAAEDGVVEYYNIQGIRLNNPTPGQIVIKRQGNQVSKMIVR